MNINEFQAQISLGEDSTRQFKADIRNAESLASELAAFANSEGGTIYLGVADDGGTPGLDKADVARINQLISNAASHLVKSPLTVRTENISLDNGRVVILLTVPNGLDKPYFDKNGVIWLKSGADKRRVNSKEELDLVNISSDSSPNTDVASGKSRENVGKASGKILDICREKPSVIIPELALQIGITERSVQRNIQKLRQDGLLRRIGG